MVRYKDIENIDMVEIDEQVVEVCKKYLPQTAGWLDDERVHIHYEDGLRFIRACHDRYDLIIVDSTDPFGPGEGLFTREFYGNCYKALKDDGIMVNQHESPFYPETRWPASGLTSGSLSPFLSAGCTRPTFPPILPDTGSLDSRQRSTIR